MELSDVVHEICQYFNLRELLTVGITNKLFNRVSNNLINQIENGKIDPDQYFNMPGFNMDDFYYPIEAMLDRERGWDINHQPATKELLSAININFNKIYYYQEGENDDNSWIIIGKSDNYFYFNASCDYTGFHCQGGGEFCYDKDWSVLWNMYISDRDRKLLLDHYGYHTFKLSI